MGWVSSLKSEVIKFLWRSIAPWARDLIPESIPGPYLVIAPHPDDETLACGATLLRARQAGVRTRVITVTDGSATEITSRINPEVLAERRQSEMIEACALLGIPANDIVFLGYKDGKAQENMESIIRDIAQEVSKNIPRLIFSPSPIDRNPDHRACASAMRQLIKEGVITCPVYEYITWFSLLSFLFRVFPLIFSRSLRRVATQAVIAQKHIAFKAHASQRGNDNDPNKRFWLRYFRPYEIFIERRPR